MFYKIAHMEKNCENGGNQVDGEAIDNYVFYVFFSLFIKSYVFCISFVSIGFAEAPTLGVVQTSLTLPSLKRCIVVLLKIPTYFFTITNL